jgi:hypothetical protein
MKQYAIFNPVDGTYKMATNVGEVLELIAEISFNCYMQHTHNSPVSIVTTNDDGSENWSSLDGSQQWLVNNNSGSLLRQTLLSEINKDLENKLIDYNRL